MHLASIHEYVYKVTMSKRRPFTTSFDEDLLKAIKKLAIDLDCAVNDLLEEGIRHLLEKHDAVEKDGGENPKRRKPRKR